MAAEQTASVGPDLAQGIALGELPDGAKLAGHVGEEAVLLSRCTDDQGEVQLSRAELYKNWGIADTEKPARAIHFNAMQPWKVARDGSVHDAMFS